MESMDDGLDLKKNRFLKIIKSNKYKKKLTILSHKSGNFYPNL
jgi:hypothetical protein